MHDASVTTAGAHDTGQGNAAAVWQAALSCFVLAAATGAALRFWLVQGFPWDLTFTNVRHAHSHAMFFAWVTPALMVFVLGASGAHTRGRWVASLAVLAGVLSFPPFLVSGYHSTPLFGRELPLSMMAAGLNGLIWYLYAGAYLTARRRAPPGAAQHAFDAALFLLILSSLAALGLAVLGAGGTAGVTWMQALVSAFLDPFADGWFALALLGLAYLARPEAARARGVTPALDVLTFALAARTLARLARDTGTEAAAPWAVIAGIAAGIGLLLACLPLLRAEWRRRGSVWTVPLTFLALKGIVTAALAVPAGQAWSDAESLRVLWLHAYLLGAVTLGLVAAARDRLGPSVAGAPRWTTAATLVLLAGLVPLTGLWPRAWAGVWIPWLAAWTALLPAAVVFASLLVSWSRPNRRLAAGSTPGTD